MSKAVEALGVMVLTWGVIALVCWVLFGEPL